MTDTTDTTDTDTTAQAGAEVSGQTGVQLQPGPTLWCVVLYPAGGGGPPEAVLGPYTEPRLAMRDAMVRNSRAHRPPGSVLAGLARLESASDDVTVVPFGPGSTYQLPEPPLYSMLRIVNTAGETTAYRVPGGWCFLSPDDTPADEAAAVAHPFPWAMMRGAFADADTVTVLAWGGDPKHKH